MSQHSQMNSTATSKAASATHKSRIKAANLQQDSYIKRILRSSKTLPDYIHLMVSSNFSYCHCNCNYLSLICIVQICGRVLNGEFYAQ